MSTEIGPDEETIKRFVGDIESCLGDLENEQIAYMNRCRPLRKAISELYVAAKDSGLAIAPLKFNIKERDTLRRLEKARAKLEDEDRDVAEYIKKKLGDFAGTPLGEAAVDEMDRVEAAKAAEKAEPKRGRGRPRKTAAETKAGQLDDLAGRAEDEADVRPRFMRDGKTGAEVPVQ